MNFYPLIVLWKKTLSLYVLKIKEMETGGRCTPFDQPIQLRMKLNNVGFTFMDRDLLSKEKEKKLLF